MPDSASTANVFLDTEVFDGQGLNFSTSNLARLTRLAMAGNVRLFSTVVTVGEIKAHLHEHAVKFYSQMSTAKKLSGMVLKALPPETLASWEGVDPESLERSFQDDFAAFLKKS